MLAFLFSSSNAPTVSSQTHEVIEEKQSARPKVQWREELESVFSTQNIINLGKKHINIILSADLGELSANVYSCRNDSEKVLPQLMSHLVYNNVEGIHILKIGSSNQVCEWKISGNGGSGCTLSCLIDEKTFYVSKQLSSISSSPLTQFILLTEDPLQVAEFKIELHNNRLYFKLANNPEDLEFELLRNINVPNPDLYLTLDLVSQSITFQPLALSHSQCTHIQQFLLPLNHLTDPSVELLKNCKLSQIFYQAQLIPDIKEKQHINTSSANDRPVFITQAKQIQEGGQIYIKGKPIACIAHECKFFLVIDKDVLSHSFYFQLASSSLVVTLNVNTGEVIFTNPVPPEYLAYPWLQKFLVLPTDTTVMNPDSIYPVPNLVGQVNAHGVNLFTSELNLTFDLVCIAGVQLSYTLKLLYNSHSASLPTTSPGSYRRQNCVGGFGWKLLDYPKIVWYAHNDSWYFLDGYGSYYLAGTDVYRTSGTYQTWQFVSFDNYWFIYDDKGQKYILTHHSSWVIESPDSWEVSVYCLYSIEDMNSTETIRFMYNSEDMTLEYISLSSPPQVLQRSIWFEYIFGVIDNASYYLGDVIQWYIQFSYQVDGKLSSLQQKPYYGAASNLAAPERPYLFEYIPNNASNDYASALRSVVIPSGCQTIYQYYNGVKLVTPASKPKIHPVICVQQKDPSITGELQDSTNLCSSIYYSFDSWSYDDDNNPTYAQFNVVKEYPGSPFDQYALDNKAVISTNNSRHGHNTYYYFTSQSEESLRHYIPNPTLPTIDSRSQIYRGLPYREDTLQQMQVYFIDIMTVKPLILSPSNVQNLSITSIYPPLLVGADLECAGIGRLLINFLDAGGKIVASFYQFIPTKATSALSWNPSSAISSAVSVRFVSLDGIIQMQQFSLKVLSFQSLSIFQWSSNVFPQVQSQYYDTKLLDAPAFGAIGVRVTFQKSSPTGSFALTLVDDNEKVILVTNDTAQPYIWDNPYFEKHNNYFGQRNIFSTRLQVSDVSLTSLQFLCLQTNKGENVLPVDQSWFLSSNLSSLPFNGTSYPKNAVALIVYAANFAQETLLILKYQGIVVKQITFHQMIVPIYGRGFAFSNSGDLIFDSIQMSISSGNVQATDVRIVTINDKRQYYYQEAPILPSVVEVLDDRLCRTQSSSNYSYTLGTRKQTSIQFPKITQVISLQDAVGTTTDIKYDDDDASEPNPFYLPAKITRVLTNPTLSDPNHTSTTETQILYAARYYWLLEPYPGGCNAITLVSQLTNLAVDGTSRSIMDSTTVLFDSTNSKITPSQCKRLQNLSITESELKNIYTNSQDPNWYTAAQITSRGVNNLPTIIEGINPNDQCGIQYDMRASTYITAVSNNCNIINQAGFLGFEWYEHPGFYVWGNWTVPDTVTLYSFTNDYDTAWLRPAHSGNVCAGTTQGYGTITVQNFAPKASSIYQISAWVYFLKVQAIPPDNYCIIGFRNKGSKTIVPTSTNVWQFVQFITTAPPASTDLPFIEFTNSVCVDDISFGPVESLISAVVYDELMQPVGTVDSLGECSYCTYDSRSDPICTARGKSISDGSFVDVRLSQICNSRFMHQIVNNEDTYDVANPNSILTILSSSDNKVIWEDYYRPISVFAKNEDGVIPGFTMSQRLLRAEYSSLPDLVKTVYLFEGETNETFSIFTEIANDASPLNTSLQFGVYFTAYDTYNHIPIQIQAVLFPYSNMLRLQVENELNLSLVSKDITNAFTLLQYPFGLLVLVNGEFPLTIEVYINGLQLIKYSNPYYTVEGTRKVGVCSTPSGSTGFRCFGLWQQPKVTNEFSSAMNLPIQSTECIEPSVKYRVTQHLYTKNSGNLAAITKPADVKEDGVTLAYRPNFAAPAKFDEYAMEIKDGADILNYFANNHSPFAYSVKLDSTPAFRIATVGSGGEFTAGRSADTKIEHTSISQTRSPNYLNSTTTDLNESKQLVVVQESSGKKMCVQTVSNQLGAPVCGIAVDLSASEAQDAMLYTFVERDSSMRPVKIHFPQAFVPESKTPYKPTIDEKNEIYYQKVTYDKDDAPTPNLFAQLPTEVIDSDSGTCKIKYDPYRRIKVVQDAEGALNHYFIAYKYDSFNRLISQGKYTYASGGNWNDAATPTNLANPLWPNSTEYSERLSLQYDTLSGDTSEEDDYARGKLTKISNPIDNNSVEYKYNAARNIKEAKVILPIAGETKNYPFKYSYDNENRLIAVACDDAKAGFEYTITYEYDLDGRVIKINDNTVQICSYEYNTDSKDEYKSELVENLQLNTSLQVKGTYSVNEAGSLTSIDYANYVKEEISYSDSTGHPNGINQISSTKSTFDQSHTVKPPQFCTYNYSYDGFGRMTEGECAEDGSQSLKITYDRNSNIIHYQSGSDIFADLPISTNCNHLAETLSNTFDYDSNGNLQRQHFNELFWGIVYDPITNLVQEFKYTTNPSPLTFQYDGHGRKVKFKEPDKTTYYIYGMGSDPLVELIFLANNSSSTPDFIYKYVYGISGLVYFTVTNIASQTTNNYYVIKDHQASVRMILDTNGAIVAYYNYQPFGAMMVTSTSFPWCKEPASSLNMIVRYRFTSREFHENLGIYNFKARIYHPDLMRFWSPDPNHQFASPYIYCPDPVGTRDRTGSSFKRVAKEVVYFTAGYALLDATCSLGIQIGRVGWSYLYVLPQSDNPSPLDIYEIWRAAAKGASKGLLIKGIPALAMFQTVNIVTIGLSDAALGFLVSLGAVAWEGISWDIVTYPAITAGQSVGYLAGGVAFWFQYGTRVPQTKAGLPYRYEIQGSRNNLVDYVNEFIVHQVQWRSGYWNTDAKFYQGRNGLDFTGTDLLGIVQGVSNKYVQEFKGSETNHIALPKGNQKTSSAFVAFFLGKAKKKGLVDNDIIELTNLLHSGKLVGEFVNTLWAFHPFGWEIRRKIGW